MSNTTPPCYCIAGHGRSGSSLMTAMFQSAGVNVGTRLMEGNINNPRGHFEDLDFHEWHVGVLTANGLGYEGFELIPSVAVPAEHIPAARALVESRRATGQPWAWKEPRSTLFLDFWQELVPELRFVLLFRSPWEVIDSLFRRGDAMYQRNPGRSVAVWENYNRAVIDFHDRFPGKCAIVESIAAAAEPERLTESFAAKFGDDLRPKDGVYEPALLKRDDTSRHRAIFEHVFPNSVALYRELQARAVVAFPPDESPISNDNNEWALWHWLDQRNAESRCRALEAELAQQRSAA